MHEITNIEIIVSKDGSHTLFVPELNETYHSKQGAMNESMYVYIRNGLELMTEKDEVSILEVGLGTGLNCLLTIQNSRQAIRYHALEPYPLTEKIYSSINYPKTVADKELFLKIHQSGWGIFHEIRAGFQLRKDETTLQEMILSENMYDLVYYDAFAPSKQEDLWLMEPLSKVHGSMKQQGILVTFCAQGQFKRNLKEIGFQVDTCPGPPGKFEMVRATKILATG